MPAFSKPAAPIGLAVTFRRPGEVPREWHARDGSEALHFVSELVSSIDELQAGDRIEITPEPDELGGPEVSRASHYS
jgi:hypothetical protein